LIESRAGEGRVLTAPAPEVTDAGVEDLMAALEASLRQARERGEIKEQPRSARKRNRGAA
ncbi:MAG: Ku protein, partial [Candidatus Dormibacteraeota bacterium]|nr:Ku protein [Candidatus Dormibacteraeota bacterium]